jgi:hypothetical protein
VRHRRRNSGRAEGERRKAHQLDNLEAHREVYVHRGRRALIEKCLRDGIATADDVRTVELPEGMDPRCFGAVPGPLARAGIIRRADFGKSNRRQRNASYISIWELCDAEAARDWLRRHPEMPDPGPPPEKENPTGQTVGLFEGVPNDTEA